MHQHLGEGRGEKWGFVSNYCIQVKENSPQNLHLNQGSSIKLTKLELISPISLQHVSLDFGILKGYWSIWEDMANTTSTIKFPIVDT